MFSPPQSPCVFFSVLTVLWLSTAKSKISFGKCHSAFENMWVIFKYFFYIDLSHNSTVIKEQTLYWNHTRFQYLCVNVLRLTLFIDWLCATLWTAVCQAPLFMGFSKQDNWNGLPYSPPGRLPKPGIEPTSLTSNLHWQAVSLPLVPTAINTFRPWNF